MAAKSMFATFCSVALSTCAIASELDLARACIVRPARENPQQKAAADDLAKHLELITGARPAEGDAAAADASAVFRFQRPAGEPAAPKCSSYARRDGGNVYFWGDDGMSRGSPQYGSGFAVAEFLERFLGVLWVRPGDGGIVFARRTKCDVPDDWRWERVSDFMVSVVRKIDPGWGMRMKYAERRSFSYGHAFSKWQARYLKDHPEYFGLNPYGRRGVEGAKPHTAKLCLSNDACIDQILANWTAAGTNRFLNVCPNDGTPGYCFCKKCLALDERRPGEGFYANLTDRYLNFWNRITERAVAIRPDVTVVTYIYSYYRHPPRRERIKHPGNMAFGLVPSLLDDQRGDLDGWKTAGLKPGTFFLRPNFTCYSGKLPRGQEREIYDSYHLYLANGSAGFDYDGRWSPVQAFEYYVIMRQIAHPEFPFERIEDEFCSQYGGLAATAKSYFARVRSRGEKSRRALRGRMKSEGNDVLDDSLLSGFAVEGHAESDLRDDLALLEGADASGLSPEEKSRWDGLKSAARGYIAAFAEAQDRARNPPAPKPEGWRASFDEPSLQGWKLRDLVGKCTTEKASFDRYSVKFTTRSEKSIALWKGGVPVTPGARYTLSFDVLAEEGAGRCGFRVVAGGKTLAAKYGTFQSGPWRRETIEFSVPDGVGSATFYFVVGDGRPDVAVYLDNVVLARQSRIILQPKIDAACAAGGGRVEVLAGEWLTGPLRLRSNVELHLSEGAVLEFSSNASEYLPTVQTSWQGHEIDGLSPLIYAKDCTNVSVTGGGRIKTDSAAWRRWHMEDSARRRPQFLQFFGCRDVRLEGFSVRGTPFWTIHIYRSEDVSISGLDVSAYGDDGFAINNSDGVDIECSRRVRVSDCSFRQNDDAIVLKSGRDEEGIRRGIPTEDVLIERCRVVSGPCMFAVGSEVGGGIRNVTMRDSTAGDSVGKLLFVKTNAKRGGFIENVLVENIRAKKVDGPLFWLLADYWYQPPPGVGNLHRTPIRGVTMRHVSAEEAESVLDLHGDSELPATGIVVEDVSVGTVLKNAVAVDNVKDLRIDGLKVANPPVVGPPPFDPSHRHQEADPPKAADVVQEALSRRLSSYAHIDMGEYMQELLVNRVAEMDRAADDAWAALKTPEEIAARRAELRERMIASVGGFPERTPLNVRKYAVHRRDGYVIENVVFESRPGHYVTAQFFVPANPAFKPPYPGVLVSCGHSKMGKAGQIYQRAAVVCAKHGFAALIFDPVDQGERQQLPGSGLMSVSGHVNAGLRAHLVGWGEAQFRLWDGIRALDLLASREDVDAKRLGVTGMSGGGTMSAYLNAVDWRFSAACPAGFLTSIRTLGDMCGPQDSEQVIHGQLAFGLNHLSLMLMNGGSALCPQFSYGDFFPYSGSIETVRKAMAFRRREGRSELIDYFDCAGPHHWYESEREAFCAWFARHLKGDVGAWPPDREALRRLDIGFSYDKVDTGLSGKPECEVLSGKGVMSLPGARSVYDLIADELARLERTRRPATPEAVARVAGIRMADAKSAKECARNAEERDGMKVVSAVLDMPDMARVPVVAFVPKQACGVPVVFAGDALNKAEYAPKVRELLAAGRAVAVVEMRGFGETGKTVRAPQWARRGADQELAAKLSWLGENLVARRAEDLLAAAEWFGGLVGGGKAELRAEGRAVVPAAHAYFVARERFAAFSSDRAPPSWTEMVRDTALTLSFAEVVYGGLKAYDWTDLVK